MLGDEESEKTKHFEKPVCQLVKVTEGTPPPSKVNIAHILKLKGKTSPGNWDIFKYDAKQHLQHFFHTLGGALFEV